jgi:hypothetical protein
MSDAEQARFVDWLSAFDDLFRGHYPHKCLVCGRAAEWAEIRQIHGCPATAVTLCVRCHQGDPHRTQLDALLAQRYRP